jgi:hypothetical protein
VVLVERVVLDVFVLVTFVPAAGELVVVGRLVRVVVLVPGLRVVPVDSWLAGAITGPLLGTVPPAAPGVGVEWPSAITGSLSGTPSRGGGPPVAPSIVIPAAESPIPSSAAKAAVVIAGCRRGSGRRARCVPTYATCPPPACRGPCVLRWTVSPRLRVARRLLRPNRGLWRSRDIPAARFGTSRSRRAPGQPAVDGTDAGIVDERPVNSPYE